jgi:hypothetical protein
LICGGSTSVSVNNIESIIFTSAVNSTDFGDLTKASGSAAACSNAHGGLA